MKPILVVDEDFIRSKNDRRADTNFGIVARLRTLTTRVVRTHE